MERSKIEKFFIKMPGYGKKSPSKALMRISDYYNEAVFKKDLDTVRDVQRNIRKNIKNKFNEVPLYEKKASKILVWDLESSPNLVFSWNIGHKISLSPDNIVKERGIICISYKWLGEDVVHNIKWNNGDDYKLLQDFVKILNQADAVITHNGDSYDNKFLFQRLIYHKIPVKNSYKRIDTLKTARKYFRFNSCKLDYLGQYLELGKKISTSYSLWTDIVLKNDKKALDSMGVYCNQDVILLEKVYNRLKEYEKVK